MIRERNFWTYLLLTIITCGLYSLYFFYVYTEDLNKVFEGDGQESPNYIIVLLLSFVTCSIYYYYWLYKQGNRIQLSGQSRYGVMIQENGTTILLWVILGSFLCGIGPFVAYYFMVQNMNTIAHKYNSMKFSTNSPLV